MRLSSFNATLTIKNLLIIYVHCIPLLRSPRHQGHGRAVTFPMAAEGHGLACSSHGFPQLGCAAVLLINGVHRKRRPVLQSSSRLFVLFPLSQLGGSYGIYLLPSAVW